ncbi:MAG: hypothetical protein AAF572_17085 [Cyanobacteria bacterium P01_B01_bin.77]
MAKSNLKSSSTRYFAKQPDSNIPLAGLITVISVIPLGMVLLLSFFQRVPVDDLTRDVTAVGQMPVYSGFLSQICTLFWAAAAAVCLFGATALSRQRETGLRHFLLISAVLTFVLGLDDAFLLHEMVFPI